MLNLDMISQGRPRRKNNALLAMRIVRTHVPRIIVRLCVHFQLLRRWETPRTPRLRALEGFRPGWGMGRGDMCA